MGEQVTMRVVSGSPTPEELAVVTAVVTAASAADAETPPEPPRRGRWNDPAWMHRRPLLSGPGGWQAAAR